MVVPMAVPEVVCGVLEKRGLWVPGVRRVEFHFFDTNKFGSRDPRMTSF